MSKSVLTGILVALVVALVGVGVYSIFANRPVYGRSRRRLRPACRPRRC